jgi:AraC-like DNA-binding protein
MLVDDAQDTRDVALAEDALGRVYRKVSLRSPTASFEFTQKVRGDDRVTIGGFDVNAPSDLELDLDGFSAVGMCSGGNYRATSNGQPVDATLPFLLPPGTAGSSSDYHRLTIVNFDSAALALFAGEGKPERLVAASVNPLNRELCLYWQRLVAHTGQVFARPELLGNDLIRRSSADALCAAAIETFAIRLSGSDHQHASALPGAVRRAMRYMDENPDAAIGVQEIAEHARMSIRGLQGAFRRTAGVTPLEYLRAVRLAEAHRELLASDPRKTTVTQIANRWGFSNITRFAGLYKRTYQAAPRETLNR